MRAKMGRWFLFLDFFLLERVLESFCILQSQPKFWGAEFFQLFNIKFNKGERECTTIVLGVRS